MTTLKVRSDWVALWIFALLAVLPLRAHGQETASVKERYARAARLIWQPAVADVKNAQVVPHWIGRTDRFWYKRQTAKGWEFLVVDAATGAKSAAFDHAALAQSLSALRKEAVSSEALPFDGVEFADDGSTVTFNVKSGHYRCPIAGVGCEEFHQSPPEPSISLSPDRSKAAFVRDGNLWIKDLKSGGQRALTTDGSPDNGWGVTPEPSDFNALTRQRAGVQRAPYWANWSPDSSRLVVAHVDQTGVAPYPFMEYAPEDGSLRPVVHTVRLQLVGEAPAAVALWAFDVTTGSHRRLDVPADALRAPDELAKASVWDKTGRHYFLFVRAGDLRSASLYDLDVVAGTTRVVFSEAGVAPALLSASGYGALSSAVIGDGAEFIWCSERDGWPHLYLYDLATGRLKNQITAGPWVVRNLVRIDEAHRQLYFVGSGREGGNPYFRSLYRVDLDGRNLRRLTPETADKLLTSPHNTFDFDGALGSDPVSPSGRYLAYTVSPLDTPPSLVVRAVDSGGPSTVVESADATGLFAAGYKPPHQFIVKAADGKSDIYGVIYRPSDYDPRKTYPILDLEYNSPIVVITPRHFMQAAAFPFDDFNTPAAAAELGLIVVMMDARGTPYRGATFSDPAPGYLAGMGLEDHVAALKALAAEDPSMDMRHVGISGASFGAWTVIRALEVYNSVFNVGVAWAPPGAFYNMYSANPLTISNGVPRYNGGGLLKTSPTAKPSNWASMDSIAQVGQMKGALLLGSGGLDENVISGSTMQFVEAATRADKHIEQVFLPNATHGPIAYLPYMTLRVWNFLVVNLRRELPPEDFHVPSAAPPAS